MPPDATSTANLGSMKLELGEMRVEVSGENPLDSAMQGIHGVFSDGDCTEYDGVVEILEGAALVDIE